MHPRERAARFFVPSLPRAGGDAPLRKLLAETPPAGLLFFRKDAPDFAGLVARVREMRALSRRPLLTFLDEEGGFVTQIAPDRLPAPSARVLGRLADQSLAERAGRDAGRALVELGIDVDFAPVFDVDREPTNPVIGPRAFSSDPHAVAQLALAFARGLESAGVVWSAKHFPGHGSTGLDSHLALPADRATRATLDAVHLPPFRAAIAANAPAILASHVAFPTLDASGAPATLSRAMISEVLRGELGYDGVVITDAMEMRAIADHLPSEESAVRALEAGCDLVLYGDYDDSVEAAIAGVARAIEDTRLTESQLQRSERRIETLFAAAQRTRASATTGGPAVDADERLAWCRRALRTFDPVVFAAPEPEAPADRGVVIEPAWTSGSRLGALLERLLGHPVRSIEWTSATSEDWETIRWAIFAHSRRTAPAPEERAALEQAQPGRALVVAFGQDAFLADYPALHRISACDPSEPMRLAVAEAAAGWVAAHGFSGPRQPGGLAPR